MDGKIKKQGNSPTIFIFIVCFLFLSISFSFAHIEERGEEFLKENAFYKEGEPINPEDIKQMLKNEKYLQLLKNYLEKALGGLYSDDIFSVFVGKLYKIGAEDLKKVKRGISIKWMILNWGVEKEFKLKGPIKFYEFYVKKKIKGGKIPLNCLVSKIGCNIAQIQPNPTKYFGSGSSGKVGLLAKHKSPVTWYLPLKLGYKFSLAKNYSVSATLGVAPRISGGTDESFDELVPIDHEEKEKPSVIFTGDVIFNFYSANFFVGLGGGFSVSSEESSLDLIFDMGIHLNPRVFLFFQSRLALDDFDIAEFYKRYSIGIGYRF